MLNRRELEPVGRLSDEPAADTLAEVVSMCSASDGEREGEARVRALFLAELPTGTWVLNNLLVPGLMGDIDLLVVGANGVFLPETKTWAGIITCASDGRTWSRVRAGRKELLPDPAAQTQRAIHALRSYLERADPGLCRRTQLWIN